MSQTEKELDKMDKPLRLSRALLKQEMIKPGATATSVAELLGVTPSAISQALDASPELKQEILEAKVAKNGIGEALDAAYDKLELKALKKLGQQIDWVQKPMEVAKILQTLNAAKRRGTGGTGQEREVGREVVALQLPKEFVKKLKIGTEGQILEADGRVLSTMPALQVGKMLAARTEEQEQEAAQAQEQLRARVGKLLDKQQEQEELKAEIRGIL